MLYSNQHNLILECFYHPQKKSNSNCCSFLVISCSLHRQSVTATDLLILETSCEWFLQYVSFHVRLLSFCAWFSPFICVVIGTHAFILMCMGVTHWFVYPSADNHCLGSSPNNEYYSSWVADVIFNTIFITEKLCSSLQGGPQKKSLPTKSNEVSHQEEQARERERSWSFCYCFQLCNHVY